MLPRASRGGGDTLRCELVHTRVQGYGWRAGTWRSRPPFSKLDKYQLLILDDIAHVTKDQAETGGISCRGVLWRPPPCGRTAAKPNGSTHSEDALNAASGPHPRGDCRAIGRDPTIGFFPQFSEASAPSAPPSRRVALGAISSPW